MKQKSLIGDCRDEDLIETLFSSVSEFARLIEENGDDFSYNNIEVTYDQTQDIHFFYA